AVTRRVVISQVVAFAPFSQNSSGCGSAGLAQAQLTQANPSGLFWRSNAGGALATTRSRNRLRATDFAEPQPPAGRSLGRADGRCRGYVSSTKRSISVALTALPAIVPLTPGSRRK